MKKIQPSIVFIVVGILVNTIPRWVLSIDGTIFCQFQALSFLFWSIAARYTNKENHFDRIMWEYAIGLALNNFYDELCGDPFVVGYIELTVVILMTLCTMYRLLKKWQIKQTT